MPFYAVARGHQTGIFLTWGECQKSTKGFSKPSFRKFNSREEAEEFLSENSVNQVNKPQSNSQQEKIYYACASSRVGPAIFFNWEDCQKQMLGTPYKFKKFSNLIEAGNFIAENNTKKESEEKENRNENISNPEKKPKFELLSTENKPSGENMRARFSGLSTFKCPESGFYKNEKGVVVVYTDGAAPSNGKRNAAGIAIGRSGCGVFFNEAIFSSFYNPSAKLPDGNTNNFAEAHAIEEALQKADELGLNALEIRTDSQYCIDSLEKWSKGWIRKAGPGGEWKNSKGEKVKHQEVFQSIINMRKKIKANLVHVRGHRDDYGNNEADRLAVEGAKQTP